MTTNIQNAELAIYLFFYALQQANSIEFHKNKIKEEHFFEKKTSN
jgi:hypothetical protein